MRKKTLALLVFILLVFLPMKGNLQPFQKLQLPYDATGIRSILQDETGMMWIGTSRGLFSYNGYNLHRYNLSDNVEIERMVLVDNYLCIASTSGLLWFNINTDKFENIHQCFLSTTPCIAIALIDGTLWVGSRDSGLYCLNLQTDEAWPVTAPTWSESSIYSIENVGDSVFIGSYEQLSIYNKTKATRLIVNYTDIQEKLIISSLEWDSVRNCLWICTDRALFRLDKGKTKAEEITLFKGFYIKNIQIFGKSILLLTDSGLLEYDVEGATFRQYSHSSADNTSLLNNILFSSCIDKRNNLWIGTDRGISISPASDGIESIKLEEITDVYDGNLFTQIERDPDGSYWLGGHNGILHTSLKKGYKSVWYRVNDDEHPINNNTIHKLFFDREGILWITTDASIAHYDSKSKSFIFHDIVTYDNSNSRWAYGIYEDSLGRLWIGSYKGGLIIVNKEELLSSNPEVPFYAENTPSCIDDSIGKLVFEMIPDENGNLWVSSSKSIFYVDTHDLSIKKTGYFTNKIAYTPGHLWSYDNGSIIDIDATTFDKTDLPYYKKDGMVYSFIPVGEKILFSTAEGVMYIDIIEKTIHSLHLPIFYCSSGLFLPEENKVIFGGEDELKIVDKDIVFSPSNLDTLYISNILAERNFIKAKNKGVRNSQEFKFHNGKNIEFELSSYSFKQNKEDTYFYRLDDEQWISLKKGDNSLFINSLSSGHHKLELCCYDIETNSSAPITSYNIYIEYPWYARWWAWIVYAVAFVYLLYLQVIFVQRRERKILEKQKQEDPFLVEVNRIIDESMSDEDFNIPALAEKIGVSQKQLSRKLKSLIEITPVNYIRRRRMQAAAALLANKKMNVQEVMYAVGFSNASYFSKCFSDEFGVKPKDYLKNN